MDDFWVCSICIDNVDVNGSYDYYTLLCGHKFHSSCFTSYINMKMKMNMKMNMNMNTIGHSYECPMCRMNITNNTLRSLGFYIDDNPSRSHCMININYDTLINNLHGGEFNNYYNYVNRLRAENSNLYNSLSYNQYSLEHLGTNRIEQSHVIELYPMPQRIPNNPQQRYSLIKNIKLYINRRYLRIISYM